MSLEWATLFLGTLASWPVVFLLAVALFRRDFVRFVLSLRSGKIGSIEFERELRDVVENSQSIEEDLKKLEAENEELRKALTLLLSDESGRAEGQSSSSKLNGSSQSVAHRKRAASALKKSENSFARFEEIKRSINQLSTIARAISSF